MGRHFYTQVTLPPATEWWGLELFWPMHWLLADEMTLPLNGAISEGFRSKLWPGKGAAENHIYDMM